MASLIEIIEKHYPQYTKILNDIKTAADSIYEKISTYEYSEINIVSHLADADGLGSLVLDPGLKLIAETLGKQIISKDSLEKENYQIKIQSKRVMSVKSDPESDESINKIKKEMGDGQYIFSDLNADRQKEFEKLSSAIIMDHHAPLDYKGKHTYINPCNYGFEGEKELSGSLLSALLLHYVTDKAKENFGNDKKSKEKLKEIDKKIDYLTMFALAGANADQQRTHGINKGIYDYYVEKNMLQKEDIPLFGYFTKTISYSIAESQLPINLKYDVANNKQTKSFLFYQGYKKSGESTKKIRDVLQRIFTININAKEIGVNQYGLNSLKESQVEAINSEFIQTYNKKLIETTDNGQRYITNKSGEYIEPIFVDFKDDEKRHNERILLADKLLNELKIEKKFMSKVHGKERISLKDNLKNRIKYFSDPKKLEDAIREFDEHQYIIKNQESKLINNRSLPELANDMTALSKMGYGDLLMRLISYEIEGTFDPNNKQMMEDFQKKEAVKAEYNKVIHTGMNKIEKIILENGTRKINSGENLKNLICPKENELQRLVEIDKGIYLLSLESLKEEINNEHLLYTTTGVFGGLTAKSRMLPGDYGIIFTALKTKDGTYKISGRINPEPKQKVHLGKFYETTTELNITESGGGHPEAASCIIKEENLDKFITYAKEQLVWRKKK